MYGMNADGWLAAHHVAHRELMEKAERSARRTARGARRPKTQAAGTPVVSAVPVCC